MILDGVKLPVNPTSEFPAPQSRQSQPSETGRQQPDLTLNERA